MAKFSSYTVQRLKDLSFNPTTQQNEFYEAYFVDAGGGMVFTASDPNGMFVQVFLTADINGSAARKGMTLFDAYSRTADGSIDWAPLVALVGVGPTNKFLLPYVIAAGIGVIQ